MILATFLVEEKLGWTKGVELATLARRDRQHFDRATWLHKAGELSKEDFQQVVERERHEQVPAKDAAFTTGSCPLREAPAASIAS